MKKAALPLGTIIACVLISGCGKGPDPPSAANPINPYEIVVFQSVDSPTGEEVRKGILRAFEANGLQEGEDFRVYVRIADKGLSEVQNVARELAAEEVDMIMPLSTACLQASLIAGDNKPIVFSAIANPYIVGAGRTAVDHLSYVTGVASTAPIRQTLEFIREVVPTARRIGTLWTPSEINSEYYLELIREGASDMGLQVVAEPVANVHEIPRAAQVLINENIDLIFPVSDNTINSAFDSLGRVAEESEMPLFGSILQSVDFGACAAMGFDFNEMGYKSGMIAVRIMGGESPARIPFQYMDEIKIHINLEAARRQGIRFPDDVLARASLVRGLKPESAGPSGGSAGVR